MCSVGPEAVFELEHMGLPFSRTEEGVSTSAPSVANRRITAKVARPPVPAPRLTAPVTPVAHPVPGQYEERDRLLQRGGMPPTWSEPGRRRGRCDRHLHGNGRNRLHQVQGNGVRHRRAGRIYASTTNAHINTGDGIGMALRAGFPVQDIEMWQFHPTGIAGAGVLVTEGCRGEGGYLINKDGERFMERYAPTPSDLAGRDVVARSMVLLKLSKAGAGPEGDHVFLKLTTSARRCWKAACPVSRELSRTFAHADPVKEPSRSYPPVIT